MEGFFVKVGGWMWTFIPAAFGSALSVYIGQDKTASMTRVEVFVSFLFGISIAHFLGGATIEWFLIKSTIIADAIKFTIGLIGMAILANVLTQIPLAVTAIRKKWLGE